MAKWGEIAAIERAVDDMREMEREIERLRRQLEETEHARDLWQARAWDRAQDIVRLHAIIEAKDNELRKAQQTIRDLQFRDSGRFARGGE